MKIKLHPALKILWLSAAMLIVLPLFGGRLPESRQDLPAPRNPMAHPIQGPVPVAEPPLEDATAAVTLEEDHGVAQQDAIVPSTTARGSEYWVQGAKRHGHWYLWALLGAITLGAGIVGRRHVRALERGQLPTRHERHHRQRLRTPWRTCSLPEWLAWTLGALTFVACTGVGIFLCNLFLGTIFVGFGITTLAILLPEVVIALVVIFFGDRILEELQVHRETASLSHGGLRGCIQGLFFWFVIIFVLVPIFLLAGSLLMMASMAIFFGTTYAVLAGAGLFLAMVIPMGIGAVLWLVIVDE